MSIKTARKIKAQEEARQKKIKEEEKAKQREIEKAAKDLKDKEDMELAVEAILQDTTF